MKLYNLGDKSFGTDFKKTPISFFFKTTSSVLNPGDGLRIFTDRDQRSICWVFDLKNLYIFWVLVTAAVFFLAVNFIH